MRLPQDIISRLKAARQQRSLMPGSDSQNLLRLWVSMLGTTLALLIVLAAYAVWRFDYWSHIEENVDDSEMEEGFYDRSTVEAVLREFDEKASITRNILERPVPVNDVATTSEAVAEE